MYSFRCQRRKHPGSEIRRERAHAARPDHPAGLVALLAEVHEAVAGHLTKEEQILFPLILAGRGPMAHMPVQVMVQEHADHVENLRRIRALTDDRVRFERAPFDHPQIFVPNGHPGGPNSTTDADNDGLADLLAVGSVENKLWIYRQQASGFSLSPDQVIELPAQTAWIALGDVEAHPGVELVLSTATGLAYLRQSRGVFESQPRALVHATQVFTNHTLPRLVSLDTQANGTIPSLPVISASQAVLYQRDSAGGWSPGSPLALQEKRTQWSIERDGWLMGASRSRSLAIRRSFLVPAVEDPEKKAEEKAVEKILVENESPERVNDVDIDGDGREDLVLWRSVGDLEPKTDIFVFLRGADNRFPERPTQVLHCRGFPVHVGRKPEVGRSSERISPVCALAGDGQDCVRVDRRHR